MQRVCVEHVNWRDVQGEIENICNEYDVVWLTTYNVGAKITIVAGTRGKIETLDPKVSKKDPAPSVKKAATEGIAMPSFPKV